jgi:2,5-diamino-6-(ribosylamino)-4(3H)-pyrimidinone 5'-phosphate reductase
MLPKVILHNTVSLNGALSGFEADLELHYGVANKFQANGFIVGSSTILSANDSIPPEEKNDFNKIDVSYSDTRPYWIVVDSKGKLKDKLHFYRRMEYIKDVIVLISEKTPDEYLEYLSKRNYETIRTGVEYVDYKKAFEILKSTYKTEILLSDSGSTLNNILLNQALIDEVSLLISPILLSDTPNRLFNKLELTKELSLKLIESKALDRNHIWVRYKIQYTKTARIKNA